MTIKTDNKKLIILGDSFAFFDHTCDYIWQRSVASELKRDLVNVAANGASANWLISKLMLIEDDISADDLLILVVPYWERVCIWPNSPDLTSLISVDQIGKNQRADQKWKPYSDKERAAFESYFLYLKNDEFTRSLYAALLHWVNSIGSRLKQKPLIIFGFESNYTTLHLTNCDVAQGCLFDVGINEFKSIDTWNKLIEDSPFTDPRIGHLSKINHEILAEKLKKYYLQGNILDLSNEFQKFFIEDTDQFYKTPY
jgi:hypothetical protein